MEIGLIYVRSFVSKYTNYCLLLFIWPVFWIAVDNHVDIPIERGGTLLEFEEWGVVDNLANIPIEKGGKSFQFELWGSVDIHMNTWQGKEFEFE